MVAKKKRHSHRYIAHFPEIFIKNILNFYSKSNSTLFTFYYHNQNSTEHFHADAAHIETETIQKHINFPNSLFFGMQYVHSVRYIYIRIYWPINRSIVAKTNGQIIHNNAMHSPKIKQSFCFDLIPGF